MRSPVENSAMALSEELFEKMKKEGKLVSGLCSCLPYRHAMGAEKTVEELMDIYSAAIVQSIYPEVYDILNSGGIVNLGYLENDILAEALSDTYEFLSKNEGKANNWVWIHRDRAAKSMIEKRDNLLQNVRDIIDAENELEVLCRNYDESCMGMLPEGLADDIKMDIEYRTSKILSSENNWPEILQLQDSLRRYDHEIRKFGRNKEIERIFPNDKHAFMNMVFNNYFGVEYLLAYKYEGEELERLRKELKDKKAELFEEALAYGEDICSYPSEKNALMQIFDEEGIYEIAKEIGLKKAAKRFPPGEYDKKKENFFKMLENRMQGIWMKKSIENFRKASGHFRY